MEQRLLIRTKSLTNLIGTLQRLDHAELAKKINEVDACHLDYLSKTDSVFSFHETVISVIFVNRKQQVLIIFQQSF